MKKFLIFTLVLLLGLFVMQDVWGQGLNADYMRDEFKYRMGEDSRWFPNAVIDSLLFIAAEIVSSHALADHHRVDVIFDTTDAGDWRETYGTAHPIIWLYSIKPTSPVDPNQTDEIAWISVDVSDVGKYFMESASSPNYFWCWHDLKGDSSFMGVYPIPTKKDTVTVYYFAFIDTIKTRDVIPSQMPSNYVKALVWSALMLGYSRKGQSERASYYYNQASVEMNNLRNQVLSEVSEIIIVPKIIGD